MNAKHPYDIDHPYLDEIEAAMQRFGARSRYGVPLFVIEERDNERPLYHELRRTSVLKYAWAILDVYALKTVADYSPLLSVGCGNGYNEHLLTQMGADVIGVDRDPPHLQENKQSTGSWFEAEQGDAVEYARQHPDRTLFMCWPTYDVDWPVKALRAYREAGGQTLIYIGEGWGGCNADDAFFEELREHWEETGSCDIPHYEGINDDLRTYARKA